MHLLQHKVNQECLLYSKEPTCLVIHFEPSKNNRMRLFGAYGYFDFL